MPTEKLVGRQLSIRGVGGFIKSDDKNVTTTVDKLNRSCFFSIEQPKECQDSNRVALKNIAGLYLTVTMYGNEMRKDIASSIVQSTPIVPCLVWRIVDFLIPKASTEHNFEGAGFNYSAMTAESGPPSPTQLFEPVSHRRFSDGRHQQWAWRTFFGTYLRSQHWSKTVSQSMHCQRDELWDLTLSQQNSISQDVERKFGK